MKSANERGVININKREFAQSCSYKTGLTQQQIISVLNCYTDFIKSQIKEGNVFLIPTIGKLIPVEKKKNKHSHPITDEFYEESTYKTLKIKIAPTLKNELNK